MIAGDCPRAHHPASLWAMNDPADQWRAVAGDAAADGSAGSAAAEWGDDPFVAFAASRSTPPLRRPRRRGLTPARRAGGRRPGKPVRQVAELEAQPKENFSRESWAARVRALRGGQAAAGAGRDLAARLDRLEAAGGRCRRNCPTPRCSGSPSRTWRGSRRRRTTRGSRRR